MNALETYLVETTHAFVTLAVSERSERGLYRATYIGMPRIDSSRIINPAKPPVRKFTGEQEGSHLEALLAACHKDIVERSGEIIHIKKIPLQTITLQRGKMT